MNLHVIYAHCLVDCYRTLYPLGRDVFLLYTLRQPNCVLGTGVLPAVLYVSVLVHTGWLGDKYFGRWSNRSKWEKKVYMNRCLILNGYRYRAIWIRRELFVRFLFCVWTGWRTKFTKETRRIAFWMLLPAYRNVNLIANKQHAIFAHELQSTLRLTVGFTKICCEL